MTEKMYRTQILLEPEQHKALAEIARREARSVSDVVREMLRQQLGQRREKADHDRQRRLLALERITEHREAILRRRGGKPFDIDVAEEINRMREERDEEIWRAATGRS